jgi:hypothetical protein
VFGSPHRLAKKRAAALHLSHDMKNTEQWLELSSL